MSLTKLKSINDGSRLGGTRANSTSPGNDSKTMENVSRDVMDPSEDSGFSTISTDLNENSDEAKIKSTNTIGEGIQFVDTALIEQEKKLILQEKKIRKSKFAAEKKAAEQAYEKEIREKQYKRLMHLLSQSKALSKFMTKKFENISTKITLKKDDDNSKRKLQNKSNSTEPKIKKVKKNMNLSNEDIAEELQSMSNEEKDEDEKENDEPFENLNLKYFKGELRDYQEVGVNWLKVLYENGLNGILADEMGLGKTIQIIALFAYLIEKKIPGPYMIVVPLSTLSNWKYEFERFAPELPVVVYHDSKINRPSIRPKVKSKVMVGSLLTHPIVLMTYEMPLQDITFFSEFHWRYIVIDEAQRIKNFDTALFKYY